MSTPTRNKAPPGIKDTMAVSRDISKWHLAVGLLAMFVLYELVRGLPRLLSPPGAVHVLASDIGKLAVTMLLGWASAKIHEVLARRRGRGRTAIRRNTLIAAWAFGLVMVGGLVAERRNAAQVPQAKPQARPAALQPRTPAGTPKDPGAYPSRDAPTPAQMAAPASGVDSSATKPVIINVVTPWSEIARRPQYVQADPDQRRAVRDLYWHVCVEDKIPREQRTSAYWQFVRTWESAESGVSGDPMRTPPLSSYLREHQAGVASPVDAETMRRWCNR